MPNRTTRRRIKPAATNQQPRDRVIDCEASLLADICEAAMGASEEGPRFKFEIRGRVMGRNLDLNYGRGNQAPESESYGVLLGRRDPPTLNIQAFRHLSLDWTGHSTDSLSEDDARVFAGLLARVRWDPGLSGFQPVGWYRVHSRASQSLSLRDLEISHRFFQEPWQVGLVLWPGVPFRARFYFREHTSRSPGRTSSREIEIGKNSPSRVRVERLDARAPVVPRPPASSWPIQRRSRQRKHRVVWPAAVLLAGALSLGSWWMMRPPEDSAGTSRPKEPSVQDANQLASAQAEALWKKWQDEFNQTQGPAPQLPDPELPSAPKPTELPAIDLPTQAQAAEADKADTPAEPTQPTRPRAASARPSRKQAPPDHPARKAQALLHDVPTPQRSPAIVPGPPSSQASRTEIPAPSPPQPPEAPPSKPPAPVEIKHDEVAAIQPSTVEPTPPSVKPGPAPTVVRTVPATIPNPAGAVSQLPAPTAGRFIWTGRLRKNETLVIDGSKASAGSSSGGLPGTPIQVTVSPGDLTKDGIVIYSARKPVASGLESAGPQNGWNKTMFEWAPDRATDIQVVEAPGPNNGWRRLVIRSTRSRNSMILVQWNTVH